MARTIHLIFIFVFIAFIFRTSALKTFYKTITTPLTGTRNISYYFQNKRGLTKQDKQRILDMHNTLRAYIASGHETRGWKTGQQPRAANMFALSWDDRLADFSQAWADTNPSTHSNTQYNDERFKHASAAENMSGDMYFIEIDMYGEVKWWNYNAFECKPTEQCGHYLAFANGYWAYMGCGWNFRKGTQTLVCNFVGLVTSGKEDEKRRTKMQHEYIKGPPCSLCEQGFDFCMSGGLCATKAQCDADPKNKCTCLNKAAVCRANGGTFDKVMCRCKCPANRYGINCKNLCRNTPNQDQCAMECNPHYIEDAFFCNKLCNGCGKDISNAFKYWYVDRPPKNRDNIKTRGFWPDPVVTPPPIGNCQNKVSDSVCATIASRNYCVSSEYKTMCPRDCNACDLKLKSNDPIEIDKAINSFLQENLSIPLSEYDLSGFEPI